jgi:hypothetical protein
MKVSSLLFTLPPKIKKNYKIVGDLSNVNNWEAKTILANSGGKVGEWSEVGYILINPNGDDIIPVSRNDEHQNGYELMHHLLDKGMIKLNSYVSIFSNGKNYIYLSGAKEKIDEKTLMAYRKFVQYGGDSNGVVTITKQYWRDKGFQKLIITIDDMLSSLSNGKVVEKVDGISKIGKRVIDGLEEVSKLYVQRSKRLFSAAYGFVNTFLTKLMYELGCDYSWEVVQQIKEELLRAESMEDYEKVGKLFFTMNGIKNNIHNAIRKARSNDRFFSSETIKEFWNDIEAADNEFQRLANKY